MQISAKSAYFYFDIGCFWGGKYYVFAKRTAWQHFPNPIRSGQIQESSASKSHLHDRAALCLLRQWVHKN